jgi:hypothetical protein
MGTLRRVALITFAMVLGVVVLPVAAWLLNDRLVGLRMFSCTHRDDAFAQSVLRDPAFDAVGKEFASRHPVSGGCDDDSQIVDVEAIFRVDPYTREEAVARARKIVEAHGWDRVEDDCFAKEVSGTPVILFVHKTRRYLRVYMFGRIRSEASCQVGRGNFEASSKFASSMNARI